jgi:hypothetical protein
MHLQNAKLAKCTAVKQVLGQITEAWSTQVYSGLHKDLKAES